MITELLKTVKVAYKKTLTSIAFLPAVIALFLLVLSIVMVQFDFSTAGKAIKSNLHWLSLKDADTARSICAAITSGVISLTVFSFSMVMILLNQAASQMTNRILDKVIGNRFQQTILGFYIGTIVYALFLLSTIRDINSGIYVPAISTYLLIGLTIADIFLFIYFLHYVTQMVKYETIIHSVYDDTRKAIKKSCLLKDSPPAEVAEVKGTAINSSKAGLYQGFDRNALLSLCEREDLVVSFFYPVGSYLLENSPLVVVEHTKPLNEDVCRSLEVVINIHTGREINTSYYYGFIQLMEIAVRALSPGINDPGTAIMSLQALGDLLAMRINHFPETTITDKNGKVRIITKERSFEEVFAETILPVWDYGKKDRLLQQEMLHILQQLRAKERYPVIEKMLHTVQMETGKFNI